MKHFIRTPYTFFMNLLGYGVRPPSPILRHMLDVTHNGWLKRIQDNGSVKTYKYNLYSN